MDRERVLPPYPRGWYALSFSDELEAKAVRPLVFAGCPIVLYRTASGVASAMHAHCPHLGAHIGYGGRVEGETLRCPFHGFRYDLCGQCTGTAYGTAIPPGAVVRTIPVHETHGIILAFSDPDRNAPTWRVPVLDTSGWSPLASRTWQFLGHPQETTENSVDIGHFTVVHGYRDVEMLKDLSTDGHYLTTQYRMTRSAPLFGKVIEARFEIHVYGLGYSLVNLYLPQFHIHARLFVLPTPIEGEQIFFRIALSVHSAFQTANIHPLLSVVPKPWVLGFVTRSILKGFANDVGQDFGIWRHKRHIRPPALAEGDGPILRYRRWAQQFYGNASGSDSTS